MNCKNCKKSLRTDYAFCPDCGGKIVRNRLTFKNLMYDFTERYFNVDNTFLRTFWHLFTKPEVIIVGYISGIRKKYLNPISYLAISVILSGILYYFLRNILELDLNDPWLQEVYAAQGVEYDMNKILDYQALMTYINLPMSAIITALAFIGKKKYNYTEHIVINAYIIAHYSIVMFIIAPIFFSIFSITYTIFTVFFLVLIAVYWMYVLKRVYEVSFGETFIRSFTTFVALSFIYVVIVVLALIVQRFW